MNDVSSLQPLLRTLVDQAVSALAGTSDLRASGDRGGQYALDLLVDGPMVASLLDAGLGVLSEEAGVIEPERQLVAIVDPVDGSTNASRGIPWYNTSICIVDDDGPLVSIVENLVTRERFEAVRGGGATRNGEVMSPAVSPDITTGIVAVNGIPPVDNPWAQFRILGASALDISYVALGAMDAYVDFDTEALGVWDYMGAMLICTELGVLVEDAFGRELNHRDHTQRRTPVAAHDRDTLDRLIDLRQNALQGGIIG